MSGGGRRWRCPVWLGVILVPLAPVIAVAFLTFVMLLFIEEGVRDMVDMVYEYFTEHRK